MTVQISREREKERERIEERWKGEGGSGQDLARVNLCQRCNVWYISHRVHFGFQDRVFLDIPKRVRIQDSADAYEYDKLTLLLVIDNVTMEDSGKYGCEVVGIATCPQCDDNRQQTFISIIVNGTKELNSSSSRSSDGNSSLLNEGGSASQVPQASIEHVGCGSVI